MSQVVVEGTIKRISHGELVEIDRLAVERGCSREEAAAKFFAPKKRPAKKAAKKRAGK